MQRLFSVLLDIKSVQFLYKSCDTDVQVVMRKKTWFLALKMLCCSLLWPSIKDHRFIYEVSVHKNSRLRVFHIGKTLKY